MAVIVVGCGRIGSALAYNLYKAGHRVAVVDQVAAAFKNLPPDFIGRMVQGDVLARDVLRRAGIEQAEGLAAVTNSDAINAVVGYVARTVYHLPRVVVRDYDPRWRPLHEAFGSQVVSSASWGVQRIEGLLSHASLRVIFSAGNAEVEIYEVLVPAQWHGRSLQDLLPADQCRVAALTRAGRAMLPWADMPLEAGDVIYLSATAEGSEALRRRMEAPQEG
jgi:trk system potassium uptake protein TrkA